MRCAWSHILVFGVLFTTLAKASGACATNTDVPEHGFVVSNTYANESLGFWFPIPDGWQVNAESLRPERQEEVKRSTGGGLELLIMDRGDRKDRASRIIISAMDATGYSSTIEVYVSKFARAAINATGGEVLREPFAADFAGHHFFRADYRQDSKGISQWGAFVATRSKGYFIGWTFVTYSAGELDGLVDALQRLSFRDEPVATGGILISHPPIGAPRPQHIRVSTRVSESLLIKRIEPSYPEDARQKHAEGSVKLNALVDKDGNVAQLSVVDGPPVLVPAALKAVRQWKYKPYLFQGEPLAMETLITVQFLLPPR